MYSKAMRVIKIIILFSISLLTSCGTKQIKTDDDYIIFQKVLEDRKLQGYTVVKEANSDGLVELLDEEYPVFFALWENNFKDLISYDDAKKIFNDDDVKNYYLKLNKQHHWPSSYHDKFITKHEIDSLRKDKNFIESFRGLAILTLSPILYTKDKNFALIRFDSGNISILYNGKGGGLMIYKKENGEWNLLAQLFNYF